jgi:hypothetical protein
MVVLPAFMRLCPQCSSSVSIDPSRERSRGYSGCSLGLACPVCHCQSPCVTSCSMGWPLATCARMRAYMRHMLAFVGGARRKSNEIEGNRGLPRFYQAHQEPREGVLSILSVSVTLSYWLCRFAAFSLGKWPVSRRFVKYHRFVDTSNGLILYRGSGSHLARSSVRVDRQQVQ